MDEPVLRPTPWRAVIHEYGETLTAKVRVYSIEEVVAEKLRAILQHIEKLEERGWSRSRARDYYDLWRIFGAYRDHLDAEGFAAFLAEKCSVRHVRFDGPDAFFPPAMLDYVERTWAQWLGPLVPNLPPFETVLGELRPQVAELMGWK